MKRANGTGSIVRLSGNRRKPYCVNVSSRDEWGRIIQRLLSYHARMAEAQEALDEYNYNRAAGLAPKTDKLSITLGEIYDLWSPRKFASGLGQQGVESYQASWLRLPATKTSISGISLLTICRPSSTRTRSAGNPSPH